MTANTLETMVAEPGVLVSTPDLRPSLLSVLSGLEELGLLKIVVSTLAFRPQATWLSILGRFSERLSDVLGKRTAPEQIAQRLRTIGRYELVRVASSKLGSEIMTHRAWGWAERHFDRRVAHRYAGRYQCVYGVEGSALETFRKQKELGGLCILRQVNAHVDFAGAVIKRELLRHPQWRSRYLERLVRDFDSISERRRAEYRLADLVMGNSEFVRQTFVGAGYPIERTCAITTGCPPISMDRARAGRHRGPLKFLFAGTLSLRKGVPYLMEAWRLLAPGTQAELVLAGKDELGLAGRDAKVGIKVLGKLSRATLDQLYSTADVFVLPTLCEGFAHAVAEALSRGLPIVTTREAGAGALVRTEQNGVVVPAADGIALANALQWCLENRERLDEMGRLSQAKAAAWTVPDSNAKHGATIAGFIGERRHGA